MSNIFQKRVACKPFEYDIAPFKNAIRHSYWLEDEFDFTSDVQDFSTKLSLPEKNVLKNALLAISQIEVQVKSFWGDIGKRFPKAEFIGVAGTFADSEVRHFDAYSNLLDVLNLNGDFDALVNVPAIQGRIEYLDKYLYGAASCSNEKFSLILALFSLFIENVSLFSQFAIVKSFNKHLNILKGIDNVVQATQQEEQVHAIFGARVVNIIKDENPEWFNAEFYEKLYRAADKAFKAECNIIDWIFENGELDFIPKEDLKEFIKDRFNQSIALIGGGKAFEVDADKLATFKWFEEELVAEINNDFFNKRSTTYAKRTKSITAGDLF